MPLVLGFALLVAFALWEVYYAEYPMFPRRLQQEKRTLALTLVITFISGSNFISVIMFWPTQAFNVYGHDPYQVGIRGIPIGFGILAGSCIVLCLLSVFKGHNRELLIISSIFMTAGMFPAPLSLPFLHTIGLVELTKILIRRRMRCHVNRNSGQLE